MTERLTEKITNKETGEVLLYRLKGQWGEIGDNRMRATKKLGELEDAEEDGRLVVFPCKVGNMVYVIAPNHRLCEAKHDCDEYDYENYLISWCEKFCPYGYKGIGVIKDIISHIEIRDNGICYCTTNCGYLYDDKVFLTREEAEKALKEMEVK